MMGPWGSKAARRPGGAKPLWIACLAALAALAALIAMPGAPASASAPALPSGCMGATLSQGNPTPLPVSGGPLEPPVTSTLVVAGAQPLIRDVDLVADITHPRSDDLDVTLTSPDLTTVTITTDNGGASANVFGNGSAGTRWDDDALQPVTDATLIPNFPTPTVQPEEAMAAFIGENPNGTWTLSVGDDSVPNDGTLNRWSLDLATFASAPTVDSDTFAGGGTGAIPNPGAIAPTAAVSGVGTYLGGADLRVDIPHQASGDLNIQLLSPDVTTTTVSSNNGASFDNVFGDGAGGSAGTLFSDDAGDVTVDPGGGPVTDAEFEDLTVETDLVAEGAFGAFIGEDPNGTWTMNISDLFTGGFGGDAGSLDSWELVVQTITGCDAPPVNTPPVADAGGPYAIDEGEGLSLDASGSSDSDMDTLTYTWDVNDDGTFGDASGATPTLSWDDLKTLGVDDGPANRLVSVRVLDGADSDTASAPLTVTNTPPTLAITGPGSATAGQAASWTFTATDPSPADQGHPFGFRIDWDGDGTVDEVVGGESPASFEHTFSAAGTFTISATATDQDAGEGPEATLAVTVAEGADGGLSRGRCANLLRGTGGADRLTGSVLGDRILGLRGKDRLTGGRGDDCLLGQRGADVLRGMAGRDRLKGGPGNDRLAGGGGNDAVKGGRGADRIFARDGRRDVVRCGRGFDRVKADPGDRLRGCELTAVA